MDPNLAKQDKRIEEVQNCLTPALIQIRMIVEPGAMNYCKSGPAFIFGALFKKKKKSSVTLFEILGDPNLAVSIKFDRIIIRFRVYPERGRRCLCLDTSVLCRELHVL